MWKIESTMIEQVKFRRQCGSLLFYSGIYFILQFLGVVSYALAKLAICCHFFSS
jgi:hypothetical protein